MRPHEYDLDFVSRQHQMMELGEMFFSVYEEQFENIRKAYIGYDNAKNNPEQSGKAEDDFNYWSVEAANAFHAFFKALCERVEAQKAKQQQESKKHEEELERMLETIKNSEPLPKEFLNQMFGE